jgi:hypothetical protein
VAATVSEARTRDAPKPTRSAERRWWTARRRLAVACTAATLLALHLRYQYLYLAGDHLVLSLKGISWADPNAFRGDWFNANAPQPHWFFDLWTYAGERLGVLPVAYLSWYVISIAVFGYATARLAEVWLAENRRVLAVAVGPLIALGPLWILGTATPLYATALPHVMGGCFAYLALVAIIVRAPRLAMVSALAAGVTHVQFGAMLVPILVVATLLWPRLPRRRRLELFGVAIALTVLAYAVTKLRGTTASQDDYLQICQGWRNYHCFAAEWSHGAVVAGFAGCALAMLIVLNRWRDWRAVAPVIALPVAGTVIGVMADRHHFPVLGDLAETTNVYRLAALVVPFAAWALVGVAADRLKFPSRLMASVPIVVLCSLFLREVLISWGTLERSSGAWPVVIGIGAAGLALVPAELSNGVRRRFPRFDADDGRRAYGRIGIGLVVAFLVVVTTASLALRRPGATELPDVADPPGAFAHFASEAGRHVPPGTTMLVPASWEGWRLWSRQPVVVDCKGLPYGGAPYHEWLRRAVDFYVSAAGIGCVDQWPRLGLADIERLSKKYHAPVAVFYDKDPKLVAARRAGWREIYNSRQSGDRAALGDYAVFRVPVSSGR